MFISCRIFGSVVRDGPVLRYLPRYTRITFAATEALQITGMVTID